MLIRTGGEKHEQECNRTEHHDESLRRIHPAASPISSASGLIGWKQPAAANPGYSTLSENIESSDIG